MEKDIKELKDMLVQAHTKVRAHKGKTWPRFGLEIFLLGVICQVNKLTNNLVRKELCQKDGK
jgi:hypothetical protein|tara:strand:- start:217 stop:402 length:186 start_codon:yes stop_codon:yes gene_type:complete